MANKLTKKDYLKVLKGLAEQAGEMEAVAFCEKEIERLANRKVSQTKTQKENEGIKDTIVAALVKLGKAVTVSELQAEDAEMAQYSNQKLSALLKQLTEGEGARVVKTVEKKKSYFAAIED